MSDVNEFVEYLAPDGQDWRIERGGDLLKAFELQGAEKERATRLMEWHSALSGIGKEWTIICRLYGVHPLYGVEEPDELLPWSVEDLASKLGLPVHHIESMESEARTFWRRWKLHYRARKSDAGLAEEEKMADPLSEEEIGKYLSRNGFALLRSEDQRRYAADRIVDLADLLESESMRAICRGMIQSELDLFFVLDPRIAALGRKIEEKEILNQSVTTENDQLLKLLAKRSELQAANQSTAKSLGISEQQTGSTRRKGLFQDSVSGLIEAVKLYHSREDSALIDGIHTAAEVEVLTTEYDVRRQQYRPDVALIAPAAIEGLFDPNFKPPVIARRAHRRLLAGFRHGLALARAEDGEEVVDLDEDARSEAAVDAAESGALPAGMEALVQRAIASVPQPKVRQVTEGEGAED